MREFCIKKKIWLPAASFFLTVLTLSAVFAVAGLFPFGEKTLAWGDMSQQVVPLLMEWKDILSGQAGMFLNLQNAGGMSFWGVFFFFLASPLHLLVVFVSKPNIYLLVNLLVLLKLSLAAATAAVFFQRESPKLSPPACVALSLAYGLCGYGMLYYQNLVWLDVQCLFPLLLLSFLRLIEEGRSLLFTLVLGLTIVLNYYLSYMVLLVLILCGGVFLGLYVPKERRREVAGKLGYSALAALLLTGVVWLPALLQCLGSARTGGGLVEGLREGPFWAKMTTTLPVLLGSIGGAALPALFWRGKGSPKARAIGVCWGLTVLPMLVEPANKLFHTGSYQAFPARYGYVPVLLGLWYLAVVEGVSEGKFGRRRGETPLWGVLALPLAAGAWLLLCQYERATGYVRTLWVDGPAFQVLGVFWLACLVALLVICFWPARRTMAGWALLALCLLQGGVQAGVFIAPAANVPSTSLAVLGAGAPADSGLYRAKPQQKFCHVNLLGAAGFPSLTHYTSLTDSRYLDTMKKLGYSAYWMEVSGCGGTGVSDILLSNKYVLGRDLAWYATGSGDLGYVLPAGRLPETLPLGDRLALQNSLARAITGEDAFTRYVPVEGGPAGSGGQLSLEPGVVRYRVQATRPITLYFDAFACVSTRLREEINDAFAISVNGKEQVARYPTQGQNGILELGSFEGEAVEVEVTVKKPVELCSFGLWGLERQAAGELAAALPNASLRWENGGLVGTAQAGPGQALFLSVPLYRGMEVRVNGACTQPRTVLGCLMEIPLPEGESRISISYTPAGLWAGGAASLTTGLLLGALWALRHNPAVRRLWAGWCRIAPALLYTAVGAVLLGVYLLPVLLCLTG
ncbi:YfhO family protein [Acutalibacter caecimuris]|uniref:YfhO family protein n=1 Tax=Acutalibacter caecimuris TaxID=3093657 RepID=UPI002AC96A05|nr:YfhO family protein [Acutalibacter sp. M00118]